MQGAGPDIVNVSKKLGADAVVLRPVRIKSLERARVAVCLKARLGRCAESEPRFPSVHKERLCRGVVADFFLYKQVYGIDRTEDFLAEHRSQGEFVGVTLERRLAELGEKAGIQPVLAALSELKEVLGSNVSEIE